MTTIVFHEGSLYADRTHIRQGTPITAFLSRKIFVSADKEFAYGVSGRSVENRSASKIESCLRRGLEALMTKEMGDEIPTSDVFKPEDNEYLKGFGSWIVMTKTRVFLVFNRDIIDITGTTNGVGTGKWLVYGMIASGISPFDALMGLADYDPFTGGGVDEIRSTDLEVFVIKGDVK